MFIVDEENEFHLLTKACTLKNLINPITVENITYNEDEVTIIKTFSYALSNIQYCHSFQNVFQQRVLKKIMMLQDFQTNLHVLIDYVNFCCGKDMNNKFFNKGKNINLFNKRKLRGRESKHNIIYIYI